MHALQINYNAQSSNRLHRLRVRYGAWPKIMVTMVSIIFGCGVCINAAWVVACAYGRAARGVRSK
jgi:hypothetical protein